MTLRIICPHCHCSVDPLALEAAASAEACYRICPECDAAIVVVIPGEGDALARPAGAGSSAGRSC